MHATATTQNAWIDNTLEHQTHQINGALAIQDYPKIWEYWKKMKANPTKKTEARTRRTTHPATLLFEGNGLYTHAHTHHDAAFSASFSSSSFSDSTA